ncbi:MAG: tetratricopeptide repeat protein, partial [Phycisphaerae bacterium]
MWASKSGDSPTLLATADKVLAHAEETDVDLLAQAAELYLRAGRLDRVDECLVRIDSLPHVDERTQAWAVVNTLKGARALDNGPPYSAIVHLRRALRRQPPEPRVTRLLALAYLKTGDLDTAADTYEHLLLLAPHDAVARLQFAEVAWRQGRLADARDTIIAPPGAGDEQRHQFELIKLACELQEDEPDRHGPDLDESPLAKGQDWQQTLERLASIASPNAVSARWLMRCFVLAGQPERAVNVLHHDVANADTAPGLGAELGRLLLSEGLGDRALAVSDELISRFPQAAEGHVLRVKALGSLDRLSDAAAQVDRCTLPAEVRGRLLEALGEEYLAADQIEPAMEVLREAADHLPNHVPVRQKLVHHTSDLNEALMRTEEIRAVEGDAGWHWKYGLAGALLRLDPAGESLARAHELLEQCLADRPRWVSARLLLGYAHERSGTLENAAEAYQTAIAQEPSLGATPAAIRLIELLKRLGRFAQADIVLNSLAAAVPEEPEVLRLRAQQQIRQRDFDSALATAEQLLRLQPDEPALAAAAADLYLRVGDAARAEAIAQAALTRFPHSTPVLWSLAQALIAQQRVDEAEARVREAATIADDAPHYLLLAQVLASLNRESEAENAIIHAQELAPQDAGVWAACTDFWGSRGHRQRQVACARKAVELRGDDPAQSLALARLLATDGSIEERAEAGDIIRRRLQADPDDPQTLVVDAQLAISTDQADLRRAEASLKHALAIDPRLVTARRLLARLQFNSGEPEAAVETVDTGMAFAPDDGNLLFTAAGIHCHRGDYERAIPVLLRFLELRPRNLSAVRLIATAYRETGRVDRAIDLVERMAPPDERTADEVLVLARLYEATHELDRAEALFLQALHLDEASTETSKALLQFYGRKQDFQLVYDHARGRSAGFPDDAISLMTAGEILGGRCPDPALRDAGMQWLDDIARNHPDLAAEATFRSGMCSYQQGNLVQAEAKFLQALRRAPNAREPRASARADVPTQPEPRASARADIPTQPEPQASARADIPTQRKSVNALAWLYAVDMGRPEEARAIIHRFLEDGGREDPMLMDTHATVLFQLGELDAARRKLEECLKLVGQTSTQAAAHYHMGLVLRDSGRTRQSIPHIRKALRLADRLGGLTEKEKEQARRLTAVTEADISGPVNHGVTE